MHSSKSRPTDSDLLTSFGTIALVVALVLADVTSAFETTMVYTAVKALLHEYGRPETIGWLLSGYLLVGAGAAAICGRLGDLYGRRAVLVLVLAGTAIGSAISIFAESLELLTIGRAIQGLSGAVLPLALGLAREHVPSRHLNMSVALITSSTALGAGLGMIVGGFIVDNFGWRHIFTAGLIMAAVSALLCLLFVPKSQRMARDRKKLDFVGGLLFLPAVACLLLAISAGPNWNWDTRVWSMLLGGLAVLAVWWIYEARHPDPLIDVKLLRNRTILLTNLAGMITALSVLNFTQLFLLLMQQPVWTGIGLGLTATMAALFKAPANFITMAAAPLWGHLADRWGPSRVMMLGFGVAGIACTVLLWLYDSFWAVVIVALVGTIGVAASFAAIPTVLVRAAPLGRVSETIGVSAVLRSIGMAIGSQAMLAILATWTVIDPAGGAAEYPAVPSYRLLFVLMAVACALALLIAAGLPKNIRPADEVSVAGGAKSGARASRWWHSRA